MIARKVYIKFLTRAGISLIGLIATSFVARYMGAEALGLIGYAISLVGLFVIFSDFGLNKTHVKKISEGKNLEKCIGTFVLLKTIAILSMALIFLLYMFFYGSQRESDEQVLVIYIIFISVIFIQFSYIFKSTFESQLEIAKTSLPNLFARIFSSSTRIIVAISGIGIYWLASAEIVFAFILFICYAYLFRHYSISSPTMIYIKSYVVFALPLVFMGTLTIVATNIDRILIAEYSSIEEVGYFTGYKRIGKAMNNISSILVGLLIPLISEAYKKNDFKRLLIIVSKSERYLSLLLTPILGISIIASKDIGKIILGSEFVEYSHLLVIFSVTMYLTSLNYPYAVQTVATGNLKIASFVTFVTMSLIIILDLILIPDEIGGFKVLGLGPTGAAFAALISIIIHSLLSRYYAYQITKSKQNFTVLYHLFAIMISSYLVFFLRTRTEYIFETSFNMLILKFFLTSVLIIIFYFIILYFFGEISKEDKTMLFNAIDHKKMSTYIKNEITR